VNKILVDREKRGLLAVPSSTLKERFDELTPIFADFADVLKQIFANLANESTAKYALQIKTKNLAAIEAMQAAKKKSAADYDFSDFCTATLSAYAPDDFTRLKAGIEASFICNKLKKGPSELTVDGKSHLSITYYIQLPKASAQLDKIKNSQSLKNLQATSLDPQIELVLAGDYDYVKESVEKYSLVQKNFAKFCEILEKMLKAIVKTITSEGIVQARAKDIVSYAEKIQRKPRLDPVNDLTDLAGSRVIVTNLDDMEKFRALVESNFVCLENEDTMARLGTTQFGYLSIHYIIQFQQDSPFLKGIDIPPEILKLKGELQVRTNLQHAWSSFGHDSLYKPTTKLPASIFRRCARLAAILEEADNEIIAINEQMHVYESNYGAYMTPPEIEKEMAKYLNVFNSVPKDPKNDPQDKKRYPVALRVAKLARSLGKWDLIVKLLSPYDATIADEQGKRELGIAKCKMYKPTDPEFIKGQKCLHDAIQLNPKDSDAFASLAGTYRRAGNLNAALDYYNKAYEANPEDNYAVGNYFSTKILSMKSTSIIQDSRPILVKAIEACAEQIESEVNLPWAYFDKALFHLFLNQVPESFQNYANAIRYSTEAWMIEANLTLLESYMILEKELPAVPLVRDLLLVGLWYRFKNEKARAQLKELHNSQFQQKTISYSSSTLILAGSMKANMQRKIDEFKTAILTAFQSSPGPMNIISGGLKTGINAVAGDIQEQNPKKVMTFGYFPPRILPMDIDKRYTHLFQEGKTQYDQENVIMYWIDLCLSDLDLKQIKLVGIGGGVISAFEYQLGLIFGAQVGLLRDSAGVASRLIEDTSWLKPMQIQGMMQYPNLTLLENTSDAIQKFLTSNIPACI